ncbi:MAG: MATE family efflux transporter [Dysosmobacter sp.]
MASITIVMYFQFVFSAMYLGFSMGVAPVVSYKYGAQDREQLQKIFRVLRDGFILLCSGAMYLLPDRHRPVPSVFTDPGSRVYAITMEGFPIYAAAFLFMGVNIFTSSLFTAFSDGVVSAVISFARTFLFLVGMLLMLPQLAGSVGIWLAVPAAELLGLVVSAAFILWGRKEIRLRPLQRRLSRQRKPKNTPRAVKTSFTGGFDSVGAWDPARPGWR